MALDKKLGQTTMGVQEIGDLMDGTVDQFIQKLQSIGGVDDLCTQILKTSPTGLREEDVTRQRATYGGNTQSPNHVPVQNPIPSLNSLVWAGAWSRDLLLIRIQFFLELIPFILGLFTTRYVSIDDDEDDGIFFRILTFFFIIFPWTLTSYLIGWTNHKMVTAYAVGQGKVETGDPLTVAVVRNGVKRDGVPKSDLVVGDLCPLPYGTIVPADGLLINTGRDVAQDLRVYSGEFVQFGGSKMIVVAVGDNTVEARMAIKNQGGIPQEVVGITNRTSILSEKLNSFTLFAIKMAIIFGIVTTLSLIIRFSVEKYAIEKQVYAAVHAQRFVSFITHGVVMFSWALPDLIPIAIVISLAVTCRRVLITNIKDGIFIRSMDNLTTFASATTLLIDGKCIDNTASTQTYMAEGVTSCRGAGMSIRVLVQNTDTTFHESFGFSKDEIYVINMASEKTGLIHSLAESGEIVAFLSTGGHPGDLEALNSAHVGIVIGHGAPSHGDIHLRTKNDFRALRKMLGRGRRVYEDLSVVFQFYIPALVVMCVLELFPAVLVSNHGFLTSAQMGWIFILTIIITLGVIYNSEREDIPGRASLGKSRLDFTTNLRRKNICGQILYQVIVVLLLYLFNLYMFHGSDLLLENGIAWMTLFNVFNAKRSRGEKEVFQSVSFKNLFVWVWLLCAILQTLGSEVVDATLSIQSMSIYQWSVTFIFGLGTLAVYQLCCLIPIGRNGGAEKIPSVTTRMAPYTAVEITPLA